MADSRLSAVKNGDRAAFEELLADYEQLVFAECAKLASKFPDVKDEGEEMKQEGRLALYNAAISYKEGGEVTFGLYAKICIHNRLISYLRKHQTAKKRKERAMQQLSEQKSSAEELFLAFEGSEDIKKALRTVASEYERRAFSMYMENISYAEIAKALGKSVKSVDNAICRAKTKLKKRLMP